MLATNVAETSLTVPGIRYVIDPGFARISRFSQRLKVQRLPIEPISQASASQRAGRCGRVADGICIRLYSEDDHDSRPEFTDPEIQRTNLASVLLQMASLDLGNIKDFPFLDPPDSRAVSDGLNLLYELGALDTQKTGSTGLTKIGRRMSTLPTDPRLARMLLAADQHGCLADVLVIVAAMSIQDPRERPLEHQQAADEKHRRFREPDSDFLSYLTLWKYIREMRDELSSSAFRRLCRDEFLHWLRIREWQDVHSQLRRTAKELGLKPGSIGADPDRIHQALLAGLLSHIGLREADGREYLGARQAKFMVFPGSGLAKKPPRMVMVGELVETSRAVGPYRRQDPARVGRGRRRAPHQPLVQRAALVDASRCGDGPREAAAVRHPAGRRPARPARAHRPGRVARPVHPSRARAGRVAHPARVLRRQPADDRRGRGARGASAPARSAGRRRDPLRVLRRARARRHRLDPPLRLVVEEDQAAPARSADLRSGDGAATARRTPRRSSPASGTPDGESFPLSYAFEPGLDDDGVTVDLPVARLMSIDDRAFDWHVPGHRVELVTELIRSLPKRLRREFVPASQFAPRLVEAMNPSAADLSEELALQMRRLNGTVVAPEDFDFSALPSHLRVTFRVVEDDVELARGKDLAELRRQLTKHVRADLTAVARQEERTGLRTWDVGTIEPSITAGQVTGYPALVDEGTSVALRVLDTPAEQSVAMIKAQARLLSFALPTPVPHMGRSLDLHAKLLLSTGPHKDAAAVIEECWLAALEALVVRQGGPVWDEVTFSLLHDTVRAEAYDETERAVHAVISTLQALGELTPLPATEAGEDVRVQLSWLIYPGFIRDAGVAQLRRFPLYLQAARRRLDAPLTNDLLAAQDLEARFHARTALMSTWARMAPRGAARPLGAGGAAGQPARPAAAHGVPGVGQARHRPRRRPPLTLRRHIRTARRVTRYTRDSVHE